MKELRRELQTTGRKRANRQIERVRDTQAVTGGEVWGNLLITWKKLKMYLLYNIQNINSTWIKDFNMKDKTLKLLERNTG